MTAPVPPALEQRLRAAAKGKRELAAEFREHEEDDLWDEEAALSYESEARELDEAADLITSSRRRVERLCSDVGRLKAKLLETNERLESAVTSERERCAKIARGKIVADTSGDLIRLSAFNAACEQIASAIAEEGKP